MLVPACAQCGANVTPNLARTHEIHCAFCKTVSATDARTRRALDDAARALKAQAASRRQLSRIQQLAMTVSRPGRVVLLALVLAVLFIAANSVAIVLTSFNSEVRGAASKLGFVLAAASVVVTTVVTYRRHFALDSACAAMPPKAPGEPCCCRYCGAPIESKRGGAVARCSFCQADNVVDKGALQRMVGHTERATGELLQDVRAKARTARTGRPFRFMATLLVLGPVVSLATPWLLVFRAENIEPEFVQYETAAGSCWFRIHQDMFGSEYFGEDTRFFRELRVVDDRKRYAAERLAGTMVYNSHGLVEKVSAVSANEISMRRGHRLELPSGDVVYATQACVAAKPFPRSLQQLTLTRRFDSLEVALDGRHVVVAVADVVERVLYVVDRRGRGSARLRLDILTFCGIAVKDGDIYVCERDGVSVVRDYRKLVTADGGKEAIVVKTVRLTQQEIVSASDIAVDNSFVYFANAKTIARLPTTGAAEMETLAQTRGYPEQITTTKSHVYWATDDAIFRRSKRGGEPEHLVDNVRVVRLLSDRSRAYYQRNEAVWRVDKGPKLVEEHAETFAVGAGTLAWTPGRERSLLRRRGLHVRPQKGGKSRSIVGPAIQTGSIVAMALDAQGLVWVHATDDGTGSARRLVIVEREL